VWAAFGVAALTLLRFLKAGGVTHAVRAAIVTVHRRFAFAAWVSALFSVSHGTFSLCCSLLSSEKKRRAGERIDALAVATAPMAVLAEFLS